MRYALFVCGLLCLWIGSTPVPAAPYPDNPMQVTLDLPFSSPWKGGLFAHDLTGDGRMEIIVTAPGHIAAYSAAGAELWHLRDDIYLGQDKRGFPFPGPHAPGAIAGDMEGDSAVELAYLRPDGKLVIRDGGTGRIIRSYAFPGAQGLAIADFRGTGDRDAVVQYSQRELRAINFEDGETLWHVTDWQGVEHGIVRVVDLDGDGLDEVLGPILLGPDGRVLRSAARTGTKMDRFDSLAVGDILPDPGLEVALAEQHGNNETIVMGATDPGWWRHHEPGGIWAIGECRYQEDPDKLAVGEFAPDRPGQEVFARSSCGNHPWVMSSEGEVIAHWSVRDTAPPGWCHVGECHADPGSNFAQRLADWIRVDLRGGRSPRRGEYGIDIVRPVHWDGSGRQLLFVTERHIDGQIALVDALSGQFLRIWPTKAARTYAADIVGDAREELIVLEARSEGTVLKIFWNDEPAEDMSLGNLWDDRAYRRLRQNWNYYSP